MKKLLIYGVLTTALLGCSVVSIEKNPSPVVSARDKEVLYVDSHSIYNDGTSAKSPASYRVKHIADKIYNTATGGWDFKFNWKWWAFGIVGLSVLLSAAQAYTGIPFLTIAIGIVKNIIKALWWIIKQVKHVFIAMKPIFEQMRPAAIKVKKVAKQIKEIK